MPDHETPRTAHRRRQYRRSVQSHVLSGEELPDADDGTRLQPALQPGDRSVMREVGADFLGQRARSRPRLAGADEACRSARPVVPQLKKFGAHHFVGWAKAQDRTLSMSTVE